MITREWVLLYWISSWVWCCRKHKASANCSCQHQHQRKVHQMWHKCPFGSTWTDWNLVVKVVSQAGNQSHDVLIYEFIFLSSPKCVHRIFIDRINNIDHFKLFKYSVTCSSMAVRLRCPAHGKTFVSVPTHPVWVWTDVDENRHSTGAQRWYSCKAVIP